MRVDPSRRIGSLPRRGLLQKLHLQAGLGLVMTICLNISARAQQAPATAPSLPIIVYHQIRTSGDDSPDGSTVISLNQFESHMRFIHDQGYTTLSMDEVVRFLQGQRFPAKSIAIHFDDGWKSQLAAVPVLQRFGFKASFWIIPGRGIGAPEMEWEELRTLAESPGFEVLSHTMTHPSQEHDTLPDWMAGTKPHKGPKRAEWELTESRRVLQREIGKPVYYLAWPGGFYNEALIRLAEKAGYKALLTIDDGVNHVGDDPLRIHRTIIHGACDTQVLQQILIDGVYRNCNLSAATEQPKQTTSDTNAFQQPSVDLTVLH
jgi:peptidoglycan/xylan/chitin deacetylase (PgdA/CDA1 family)